MRAMESVLKRQIIGGNVNTHTQFNSLSNETIQKQKTKGRLISCETAVLAFASTTRQTFTVFAILNCNTENMFRICETSTLWPLWYQTGQLMNSEHCPNTRSFIQRITFITPGDKAVGAGKCPRVWSSSEEC